VIPSLAGELLLQLRFEEFEQPSAFPRGEPAVHSPVLDGKALGHPRESFSGCGAAEAIASVAAAEFDETQAATPVGDTCTYGVNPLNLRDLRGPTGADSWVDAECGTARNSGGS
jgi:hypothetical protein